MLISACFLLLLILLSADTANVHQQPRAARNNLLRCKNNENRPALPIGSLAVLCCAVGCGSVLVSDLCLSMGEWGLLMCALVVSLLYDLMLMPMLLVKGVVASPSMHACMNANSANNGLPWRNQGHHHQVSARPTITNDSVSLLYAIPPSTIGQSFFNKDCQPPIDNRKQGSATQSRSVVDRLWPQL
jgi:hypothetical protein